MASENMLQDPNYRPPLAEAVPLGIQHVLAMFAGNITVPLLIALAAGPEYIAVLVQIALLAAGVATLIQTIVIGPVGSRLPVVQGTSFAYVGILTAAIKSGATMAAVFGASLAGGLIQMVLGYFIPQVRKFIPALVSGVVVMTIGFTLLPVGIKYAAGCGAYPAPFCEQAGFGSASNWAMALFVIIITLLIRRYGRGVWSSASIFIGLVIGYLLAIPFGMVDGKMAAAIAEAAWVGLPDTWFGLEFTSTAAISLIGLMIHYLYRDRGRHLGHYDGRRQPRADRPGAEGRHHGGRTRHRGGGAVRRAAEYVVQPERRPRLLHQGHEPVRGHRGRGLPHPVRPRPQARGSHRGAAATGAGRGGGGHVRPDRGGRPEAGGAVRAEHPQHAHRRHLARARNGAVAGRSARGSGRVRSATGGPSSRLVHPALSFRNRGLGSHRRDPQCSDARRDRRNGSCSMPP